jgi:hypothetical protein
MITLDVDGPLWFRLAFRHARNLTHVKAITTCVILATELSGEPPAVMEDLKFTAIGTALCWPADNFSRRVGRLKAFANALDHCGLLRDYRGALFAEYMKIDPDPPPPPPRVREKLSDAEKKKCWELGWKKRLQRADRSDLRKVAQS